MDILEQIIEEYVVPNYKETVDMIAFLEVGLQRFMKYRNFEFVGSGICYFTGQIGMSQAEFDLLNECTSVGFTDLQSVAKNLDVRLKVITVVDMDRLVPLMQKYDVECPADMRNKMVVRFKDANLTFSLNVLPDIKQHVYSKHPLLVHMIEARVKELLK